MALRSCKNILYGFRDGRKIWGASNCNNPDRNAIVLSGRTEIEFARLLGLRTLLGFNSVPEGTYDSATLSLADPVISFLDLTTTPASVGILAGLLTQTSITIPLDPPLVVRDGGLAALNLHFPLGRSLQTDSQGELTGVVDPRIHLRVVPPASEEAFVDELRGGLSSVEPASNSFVLQTRRGRSVTILVDGQTIFEGDESLSSLQPPAIIEVSGQFRQDGSLRASSVEVLTREGFMLGGLVLSPDPEAGPANRMTILVREEFPDLSSIEIGRIATVEFNDRTRFDVHHLDLPFEFRLFNRGALVRGQRVAVGGRIDDSTSQTALRIGRVVLHRQGFKGIPIPASVRISDGNNGMFRMRTPGLFGLIFGEPLRVITSNRTRFGDGLDGLAGLANSDPAPTRVVGLLLRDGGSDPVLVAYAVHRAPAGP